ncbi:hypothetical protein B591_20583 [Streptomyces sp. GBA 94-10 4N24]|nr:hypothetical protein B591_20583 [Streptomyces sp. GBA 94-10 4N24]UZN61151.1 hypothetical protein B591N_20583 [Streptomyces sp. GBA 94-10 4N24]
MCRDSFVAMMGGDRPTRPDSRTAPADVGGRTAGDRRASTRAAGPAAEGIGGVLDADRRRGHQS